MRLVLFLFLQLAGCAAIGSDWPSLALRSSEKGGAAISERAATDVPDAAPDPVAQRAAEQAIARDLDAAEVRWRAQSSALDAKLPTGRPPAAGSERWAEAQVELSRLEVIGAELGDIAARAADLPADPGGLARRANAALDRHRAAALAARTLVDR